MTPLQYERVNGEIMVASGWGPKSDWICNLRKNPHARMQIRLKKYEVMAELITDSGKICEFLELRLKRHPLMVGAILHSRGLSFKPGHDELLAYSQGLAMAVLHRV